MRIDYVSDTSGDWVGIYLNDVLFKEGHTFDHRVWLDVLVRTVADGYLEISKWESSLEQGGRYPTQFGTLVQDLTPLLYS